ncbi:MAG: hypothetical protein ACK5MZ_09575 [Aestuariibaculum sp.]
MNRTILSLFFIALVISCGKEKKVFLPEIEYSKISEITDVSAAYLFYNEKEVDSVEFNRRNLIGTTNWLVNVDKRLNLKQVIPHIKFLQEKKKGSKHKNEGAKSYFTCHDTSINNLGFIAFTGIVYHTEPASDFFSEEKNKPDPIQLKANIQVNSSNNIEIMGVFDGFTSKESTINNLIEELKKLMENHKDTIEVVLSFSENLSFQEYISVKSKLETLDTKQFSILKHEFILASF